MSDESISLQRFISNAKSAGYTPILYTLENQVLFIKLYSKLHRKPFMLQVPSRHIIQSKNVDHILEISENNYQNYRQREYLTGVGLDSVVCSSKINLCIKSGTVFNNYLVDNLVDESDDSESDSDIEIDDYPVEDIYPMYNMMTFLQYINEFEDRVQQDYETIIQAEEEMNENNVQHLLMAFDQQKLSLKEKLFHIHQDAYNIRRDISKYGKNLQRSYSLKEKTINEKDRVRFQVERLVAETEAQIDTLNDKLKENRDHADLLLLKYQKYIEQFKLIE